MHLLQATFWPLSPSLLVSLALLLSGAYAVFARFLRCGIGRNFRPALTLAAKNDEWLTCAQDLGQVGIWEMSEQGTIWCSPYELSLLGLDANAELTFARFLEMVHPEYRPLLADVAHKQPARFEMQFKIRRMDGQDRWLISRGKTCPSNAKSAYRMVGTHIDITPLKISEQALLESKKQAEAATESQSAFLANMSHELRTPLNGILGLGSVLRDTGLDLDQAEMLDTMLKCADALKNLVTNLLEFSQLDASSVNVRPDHVDLKCLIERCFEVIKPDAAQKQLAFSLDTTSLEHFTGWSDPVKVERIVLNLLSNAIKFTEKGSVVLRAGSRRSADRTIWLKIAVEDTGMGVPSDMREYLFQQFTQADLSATRKHGGMGLGLAISKELVELLRGTIGFDSRRGRGSTFWFEIPLDASQKAKPAQTPERTTEPSLQVA